MRDPRVQGVTITEVQMQGDLSLAKVYYTIMSDLASDNQKAQTGLEKATGTIKRELGKQLTMYKIPDLVFEKTIPSPMVIKLINSYEILTTNPKYCGADVMTQRALSL